MIGTTRSRVSYFMNRFRQRGFIEYNGRIPGPQVAAEVDRNELSLAIDETETTCDVSIAMNAYKSYGISAAQADKALQSVEMAVAGWRTEANRFGIPKAEQALMAAALEI